METKIENNEKINLTYKINKKENNNFKKNKLEKIDKFNYDIISKILIIFIILSPIFDIVSFCFRNKYNSKISISTFLRPIIPILISIYIFITANKKNKKVLIEIATIYILYAISHLLIVKNLFTGCSDGTILNETQYICNFTFLIIDLIIYLYTFIYEGISKGKAIKNNYNIQENSDNIDNNNEINKEKINKNKTDAIIEIKNKISNTIAIMVSIYLISILISIITNTSSPTYIETKTGYKGWIESGNSLSAILVVSLFIILTDIDLFNLKTKKFEIFKLIISICDFIYLTTLIGTRTGLIGAFLAFFCYIIVETLFNRNKKILFIGTTIIIIGVLGISIIGSKTLKRREQMKQSQFTIIDKSTGQIGNITGDMLDIKNSILDGTIDENFMSEAQKEATIELYEYAKKHKIAGNNTRKQQLIYNIFLIKNQKNFLYILFGNGFKTNFREMVMENELASIILNFGIIGFILYVIPLIIILILSIKSILKNLKIFRNNKKIIKENKKDDRKNEYKLENYNLEENISNREIEKVLKNQIMYALALTLILVLSWFSGYVLFATSNMVLISVIAVLNKIYIKNNKTNNLFYKFLT